MRSIFYKLRHIDKMLAVICFLLLLVGLSLTYSLSFSGGGLLLVKQLIYVALGILLFLFFCHIDYSGLTKISRYLYLLFIVLLVALFFIGLTVKGSSRWFDLGLFLFQPAEFMKLVMILVLARFFALHRGRINTWKSILLSLVYVLIPAILIAKEPDLGSAIILFVIWGGMLMLSSVHKRVFIYLFLALGILSALSWTYFLQDYQRTRIETFINPNLDPQGSGYNVRQAIIAVGSGELTGRGLGKGLQSQLKFLPERHTDFIFASAAEELGFIGTLAIIILYFLLLFRLLKIYQQSRDDLGRFIAAGVFSMMFGQIVINIGMNMGVLPVTGIPLPLLSYGGSSFLTVAMSMGLAEAVAIRGKGLSQ